HDLKLLLAYGTVSQLGFLITIIGVGTRSAALAGIAMVTAHALFKSALFLIVGVVDRSTGSRDLRKLSGMRRTMPVVFVITLIAAPSMAGLPPLAGFVAKEAVFAAFIDLDKDTGVGPIAWVVLAGLVLGSILTMAYTARFVWGIFGDKQGVDVCVPRRPASTSFILAPAVLAAVGLVVGFLGARETELLRGYVDLFPEGAHEPELVLWHGFNLPLALSAVSVIGGLLLFLARKPIAEGQRTLAEHLRLPDAERAFYRLMRGIDRLAVEVTGATQRGSLPVYLTIILLVLIAVPGSALVRNREWGDVYAWDTPIQAVVAAVIAIAAIVTARSRRRLRAVLVVGVTGYGTAMLFVLHGAPDLALTQILVETVMLVIFILVLRRLPPYFSVRPVTGTRWFRVAIGVAVGAVAAGVGLAAAGSRTATPISTDFAPEAVSYGGGKNIVNVILVDIRAWDTLGELSVLVVAATGVASLIYLITGRTTQVRPSEAIRDNTKASPNVPHKQTWLRAGRTVDPASRSIVFEVITRLVFHTVIVFSVYLIFSGHNAPGGGFAGGLIAGIALMIRYLAGGRYELDEAAPVDAGLVLGLGLATAALSGLVPILLGGEVLQSATIDISLGFVGELHLVTSLFFDLGVYLVVVGLMLDILRSLGGGIDADQTTDEPTDEEVRV
ncbi:MAG: monovalent cation/H+ antiporter subunit, partial [Nocardioidaceae bacterium]|nr:monovalent cation/H+ antiporter subunit [Nocardioidaceae bacterium]